MSEDTSKDDEILVSRGGTEYEKDGEVHVIDYGGYPLIDINPELVTEEISLLAKVADLVEVSDEYLSLEGKTQVVNIGVDSPETLITTRIIHDMQVAQNAMRIAMVMGGSLKDIMLARIAGLGHDIGHAPFGHDGQAALSSVIGEYYPGSRFSHDRYGGEIINEIITRAISEPLEEDVEGFTSPEEIELIESLREEIKLAVINHSRYFSYRMKEETLSQKSVRLADTLSFMVTDLSDLMKAEDARTPGSGQKILPIERVYREIDHMPFLKLENKKKLKGLAQKLLNGGAELREVHEILIQEAFEEDRPLLDEDESASIVDDIKLLYDLESICQKMEKTDNIKTRIEAFRRIGEYYRYINKLTTGNKVRINNRFKVKMRELLGFPKEKEENAKHLIESLMIRLGDIDYSERDISDISYFSTEELEIIKKITNNALDNSDPFNLRKLAKTVCDQTLRFEIDNAPTLLTLFTIQNRVQYGEILSTKDGREALGNKTIVMPDGTERDVEDLIKDRFGIVFKMAREFQRHPQEFKESSREVDDLKTYFGSRVPSFYGKLFGTPYQDDALSYAVFAIQQMQNKDFLDDSIVDKIRLNLGISEKQFEDMKEELSIEMKFRRDLSLRELSESDTIDYSSMVKGLMKNVALFGEISEEEAENPTLDMVIERSRKMDELRKNQIETYGQFVQSGLKDQWQQSYIKSEAYFKKLAELISRKDYEAASNFIASTYLKQDRGEDKGPNDSRENGDD